MFDWEAALKDEQEGHETYLKAAKEMKEKYPGKLYSLQFEFMANQELKHWEALKKMMEEIKNSK